MKGRSKSSEYHMYGTLYSTGLGKSLHSPDGHCWVYPWTFHTPRGVTCPTTPPDSSDRVMTGVEVSGGSFLSGWRTATGVLRPRHPTRRLDRPRFPNPYLDCRETVRQRPWLFLLWRKPDLYSVCPKRSVHHLHTPPPCPCLGSETESSRTRRGKIERPRQ